MKTQKQIGRVLLQRGSANMCLAEALDRFIIAMNGVKSPRTIIWYRSMLQSLVDYLGDIQLTDIETDDLRQWRGTLAGKTELYVGHPKMKVKRRSYAPSSLHGHVRACRTFFKWLQDEGRIKYNPADRLELPPQPKRIRKGVSDEARLQIIEAVASPKRKQRVRDTAMVHFMDDTTCRAAGVVGLTLDHLDLAERSAYVMEKGLGGNRKGRTVFFSPETAGLIQFWLDQRPACDSEHVFVTSSGKPLSEKGLYEVLRRAARDAGVKKAWSPHQWRHGTIRRMKKKGINLAIISQLCGHSTVALTGDLYGTLDDSELKAAVDGVMW